jgi:folylpolyglutamate synthase/dihydropteroate synthase
VLQKPAAAAAKVALAAALAVTATLRLKKEVLKQHLAQVEQRGRVEASPALN